MSSLINRLIIGLGNGLAPMVRRQAITWTNADTMSTTRLGTNLSEILIQIESFPPGNAIENVLS